jgi:hypothetical protein
MNYIYNKESLDREICNELISLIESEQTIIIHTNPKFTKLYNHLYYEINIQLSLYITFLNEQSKNIPYKYFHYNQFYINNFTIYELKNEYINKLHNNIEFDFKLHTYSILRFIWILNEIDNELVFLNNTKIKTFVGQIIIFPCYWSFPFKDTNLIDTKNFIIGYIEIENEDSKIINKEKSL